MLAENFGYKSILISGDYITFFFSTRFHGYEVVQDVLYQHVVYHVVRQPWPVWGDKVV